MRKRRETSNEFSRRPEIAKWVTISPKTQTNDPAYSAIPRYFFQKSTDVTVGNRSA